MLAVLDTNILVSSIINPQGNEAQVIRLARDRTFNLALSTLVLAEYRATLERPRFRFKPEAIDELLVFLHNAASYVSPQQTLSISPHPADNRFLECAEAASADFLVTGNLRHFPPRHGATRILRAPDFLAAMQLAPT